MNSPKRIQLSRKRGWRMPENTVKVDRSTKWGNPFFVGGWFRLGLGLYDDDFSKSCLGYQQDNYRNLFTQIKDNAHAVKFYKHWLTIKPIQPDRLAELRGKNLACWCRLCDAHKDGKPLDVECGECAPCHVDPLGVIANAN